ncbi:DUF1837 domain-containing protein [Desulfothermus okinawensis JCM 13304]
MSIFNSEDVITQHISKADLRAYFVGYDFGKIMLDSLIDVLMDALVDFAFGYHKGILKDSYNRRILKEAAKSIYKIDVFKNAKETYIDNNSEYDDEIKEKYLKRGEFGELILHLILRDFINTIPLISKIYFKDSDGMTVHGFDAVHIGPDLNNNDANSIFFGESKLYNSGKKGVLELLKDVEVHFKRNFLEREFVLIGKKKNAFITLDEFKKDSNHKDEYEKFFNEKDEWFNKLDDVANNNKKLEELFKSVTIPLLCTYKSDIFYRHKKETENFIKEYEEEVQNLKHLFDEKLEEMKNRYKNSGEPIQSDLNIIVMLFPVPDKNELVRKLHTKLYHIQEI